MTLVLGIDPGTATTGYGLVRDREDGSLESVTLAPSKPRQDLQPISVYPCCITS